MRADPLAFLTTELNTLRERGLYRRLRILETRQQAESRFDSRTVVDLSSNNYLGLTTHPKLVDPPVSPCAAVSLFHVSPAVGGGKLFGRDRCAGTGTGDHRPPVGQHAFFKAGLVSMGFDTGLSESPITPVIAGEGSKAMKLSDRLFEEGVFAQGIAFLTVARDKARVRTIATATHTKDELQFALDAFKCVGGELGLS